MTEESEPPQAVSAVRERLLVHLIGFVDGLRERGVRIPANGPLVGAEALATVGLDDTDRARVALRAALVSRAEDVDTFDSLFPEFWRAVCGAGDPVEWTPPEMNAPPTVEQPDGDAPRGRSLPEAAEEGRHVEGGGERAIMAGDDRSDPAVTVADESPTTAVYSPVGDSAKLAGTQIPLGREDPDALERAVDVLGTALATRPGRRWHAGGEERIHVRRALRGSIAHGGIVGDLPGRARPDRRTRAVVLVDVSQSVLDTVDRGFLVGFLVTAHRRWSNTRTFFFDTDVQEVSDAFEVRGTMGAVTALERAEAEWGGGTRIGWSLERALSDSPGLVDRDTAVLVVSDGLEVGELDRLEAAMAQLHRRAATVLWLNPLAADPEYEPVCRGMETALGYVDGLFAFTGPGDLEAIARQLDQRGVRGRLGYQFDPRREAAATAGVRNE